MENLVWLLLVLVILNYSGKKNRSVNLGLDLTLLDRISVTFDYYVRTTSDLIFDLPISAVPGYYNSDRFSKKAVNVGSLRNRGYEITIQSNNLQTKDLTWTTMLNFGHNHNELTKIYGEENQIISGVRIHKVGEPYYSYYGYEYAGVDPILVENLTTSMMEQAMHVTQQSILMKRKKLL